MNRHLTRVLAFAALMALPACAAQPVHTDFDDTVAFSEMKTYAWLESDLTDLSDSGLDVQAINGMIREAVDRQLVARGLSLAAGGGGADIHVMYHATVERRMQVTSIQMPPPQGDLNRWYYRPPPPPAYRGSSSTEMYEYDAGTLVLSMLDPATERPVWKGRIESAVARNRTDEQRRARIDEVVGALLADFPPR
jgi:hypothetical protein